MKLEAKLSIDKQKDRLKKALMEISEDEPVTQTKN